MMLHGMRLSAHSSLIRWPAGPQFGLLRSEAGWQVGFALGAAARDWQPAALRQPANVAGIPPAGAQHGPEGAPGLAAERPGPSPPRSRVPGCAPL
eukprot:scaffold122782_cov46-Prasinocladus_malaysianus.AAC.1